MRLVSALDEYTSLGSSRAPKSSWALLLSAPFTDAATASARVGNRSFGTTDA